MNIIGRLEEVLQPKNVGKTKDFWVRDFSVILHETSKFPQTVLFQGVFDVVEDLNSFSSGDYVDMEVFIRGRKQDTRFYNTLEVRKITRA